MLISRGCAWLSMKRGGCKFGGSKTGAVLCPKRGAVVSQLVLKLKESVPPPPRVKRSLLYIMSPLRPPPTTTRCCWLVSGLTWSCFIVLISTHEEPAPRQVCRSTLFVLGWGPGGGSWGGGGYLVYVYIDSNCGTSRPPFFLDFTLPNLVYVYTTAPIFEKLLPKGNWESSKDWHSLVLRSTCLFVVLVRSTYL